MKSVKNQKKVFLISGLNLLFIFSVQANEGGESSGNVAFKNSSFLELTMGPSSICATHTIFKKRDMLPKGKGKHMSYTAQLGYLGRWNETPLVMGTKVGGVLFSKAKKSSMLARSSWNTSFLLGTAFSRFLAYGELGYVSYSIRGKMWAMMRLGGGLSFKVTPGLALTAVYHNDSRKAVRAQEILFGFQYWFSS